jgi:hypothetical protein
MGFGQSTGGWDIKRVEECRNNWQFFILKKTITGEVVSHAKAGPCGSIAFASITIIRLQTGDTIRVLNYCNDREDYMDKNLVTVKPLKNFKGLKNKYDPSVSLSVVALEKDGKTDLMDCFVKKTCYGSVSFH